jgi:hypothetical protein
MSKFNSFRRKLQINDNCIAGYESAFIVEGTSAVVIHNKRLDASQKAAIIITDKEGPDTSLVYTYKERAIELELLKGDYYIWNKQTYFVYEDVQLVMDVNYKKQKSYQCNVCVQYNDSVFGGYFVSSLAKYIDTTLQSNLNITNNEKPVLVLPDCDWVKTGAKIIVKNRPYKIIDIDNCTNDGIAYCSLELDFIDKHSDGAVPVYEDALIAGVEQTIPITNGEFYANHKVEIVRKSKDSITIIVPYGVDELTVNADKTYKVVI